MNFASEWLIFSFLWVDKRNRDFFPKKLSQRVQIMFFLNSIWRHLWILWLTFLKNHISSLWDNFSGKKLSISLIYSQKEKIWSTQKQNSFVGFRSVWNGRVRPLWPHPSSKFEKKHITSFLDRFPGSVTNFTSFHVIWRGRVLAP